MTQYVIQTLPHAGAAVTLAAPGGTTGDTILPTAGAAIIVVVGATPTTVTLPFNSGLPGSDGLAIASRTVACAASSTTLIPVPPSVYGTQLQQVQYSSTATVTVGAVFIPTT